MTKRPKSPYGWEMAFAWCPSEDSPLLGATPDEIEPEALRDTSTVSQEDVTRRYDRMAWLYDLYDAPMEWMGTRKRRHRLLARARGRVMEAGIGTGKNLAAYPPGVEVVGIDVSEAMLDKARSKTETLATSVTLKRADVTKLPLPDDHFDTAVATCVFCSVADPVAGLRELGRVTKPDGQVLLLEHVRPRNPLLGRLADWATAVTRRVFGFRANRRTEENVEAAGLQIVEVTREGIWREIVARPPHSETNETTP